MNISGTITIAEPVDSTDQNQTKYQWITIQGPEGPIRGRIGSKQGYQQGTPINVTVEVKQGQDGQYNYFKRYNPQYGQPSQGSPSPTSPQKPYEAAPIAPQSPNGNEMRIVREVAIKAVLKRVEIPLDMVEDFLLTSVQFILSGVWKLRPRYGQPLRRQDEPDAPEPIEDNPDNY